MQFKSEGQRDLGEKRSSWISKAGHFHVLLMKFWLGLKKKTPHIRFIHVRNPELHPEQNCKWCKVIYGVPSLCVVMQNISMTIHMMRLQRCPLSIFFENVYAFIFILCLINLIQNTLVCFVYYLFISLRRKLEISFIHSRCDGFGSYRKTIIKTLILNILHTLSSSLTLLHLHTLSELQVFLFFYTCTL